MTSQESTTRAAILHDGVLVPIASNILIVDARQDAPLEGFLEKLIERRFEFIQVSIQEVLIRIAKSVLNLLPHGSEAMKSKGASLMMLKNIVSEEELDLARNVALKYACDRIGIKLSLSLSNDIQFVNPFDGKCTQLPSSFWRCIEGNRSDWLYENELAKVFSEFDALDRQPRDAFVLKEQIHKGIMCSIYRGEFRGESCAAKVYFVDQMSERQKDICFRELAIMREVCASKACGGVVEYYGYCFDAEEPRRLVVLMSLGEKALNVLVSEAPTDPTHANAALTNAALADHFALLLPPSTILNFASQLLTTLSFLHRSSIVHRDLKCANVLVSYDDHGTLDKCQICDFGFSERLSFDGTCSSKSVGSSRWMAPEVHDSLPADWRSDIWSFGMLLLELLTGKLPYHNILVLDVPKEMSKRSLPDMPWRPIGSDPTQQTYFEKLKQVILSCLVFEPSDRPTADFLLKKLR